MFRAAKDILFVLRYVKTKLRGQSILESPNPCLELNTPVLASYFYFFCCQTLAIDKWNTDSVEEFLDIYLMKEEEITQSEQQTEALP